jgi:hypothetical protein
LSWQKHAGLTVIADASESDRALLETLGADVVDCQGRGLRRTHPSEHFPDGVDGLADGALLNEKAIPGRERWWGLYRHSRL